MTVPHFRRSWQAHGPAMQTVRSVMLTAAPSSDRFTGSVHKHICADVQANNWQCKGIYMTPSNARLEKNLGVPQRHVT